MKTLFSLVFMTAGLCHFAHAQKIECSEESSFYSSHGKVVKVIKKMSIEIKGKVGTITASNNDEVYLDDVKLDRAHFSGPHSKTTYSGDGEGNSIISISIPNELDDSQEFELRYDYRTSLNEEATWDGIQKGCWVK